MYTKEGEKYMNCLWTETLEELNFPEVRKALQGIGGETAA
jgi:hypothetical protein